MDIPHMELPVKLLRDAEGQFVCIPSEFELPGEDAIMRKEGDKLIIELLAPPLDRARKRPRQTRSSREYSLHLLGEEIKVRTLGEALSTTLLKLESAKPGFLDKLSKRQTKRIIAHKPEDLFQNRPDLTSKYAYRLGNSEWYFKGLMSAEACATFLEEIASVAGIEEPRLVDRSSGKHATPRGWA
jgi:antitoxin VapB